MRRVPVWTTCPSRYALALVTPVPPSPAAPIGAAGDPSALPVGAPELPDTSASFAAPDLTGGGELWLAFDPMAEPGFDATVLVTPPAGPDQVATAQDEERLATS